jgi:hypothetical protein
LLGAGYTSPVNTYMNKDHGIIDIQLLHRKLANLS